VTHEDFAAAMSVFAIAASPDELAVVAKVSQRMHEARGVYGALDLAKDTRDFKRETAAEAFDGMSYAAMQLVREERAASSVTVVASGEELPIG
jgi:hypothetical protein